SRATIVSLAENHLRPSNPTGSQSSILIPTMKEKSQLKELLLEQVKSLRRLVASLKASERERRQTEEALSQSEGKYRLLFKSLPLAAWVYDVENLRFLAVNHVAVE